MNKFNIWDEVIITNSWEIYSTAIEQACIMWASISSFNNNLLPKWSIAKVISIDNHRNNITVYLIETKDWKHSLYSEIWLELNTKSEISFMVWDIIKFKTRTTEYVIVWNENGIQYKHMKNWNVYWCKKDSNIEKVNKTIEHYKYCLENCSYVLESNSWEDWIRLNIKTLNWISTGNKGIDDTIPEWYWHPYWTVDVNKEWTILKFNNNTMTNIQDLRAKKYFSDDKNLEAIEATQELLESSLDTLDNTKDEISNTQTKLSNLRVQLNVAVSNNDIKKVKQITSSIKKIKSYIEELNKKTIGSFKPVEEEFDIDSLLK